tara:strand:- start:7 stop:546 length:540 start_codon:yes stop_codon:yes gene_type:complete
MSNRRGSRTGIVPITEGQEGQMMPALDLTTLTKARRKSKSNILTRANSSDNEDGTTDKSSSSSSRRKSRSGSISGLSAEQAIELSRAMCSGEQKKNEDVMALLRGQSSARSASGRRSYDNISDLVGDNITTLGTTKSTSDVLAGTGARDTGTLSRRKSFSSMPNSGRRGRYVVGGSKRI